MKTKILLATGAALVALGTFGASHQAKAVTGDGDVDATIIQPIDVNCTVNMDFGDIIPAVGSASTVVLTTAGVATPAGGATHLGGEAAGECTVSGDARAATFDISAFTTVDDVGAGTPMTMQDFTFDYNASAGAAPLGGATLVPAGATLLVGATLNVGDNQLPGAYTGSFTVEVIYD
ncbi:MAG: DUF4402 domain-containing protein [Micavibrio sp.]